MTGPRTLRALLLVLLLAAPAQASPPGALQRLASEDLLDTTRAELVAQACAAPELAPDQLAPLFQLDRRTPPIDAARIATCRRDPALLPLMFSEFARSSLGAGASTDPDIFEQLLRGMQQFPLDVVRRELLEGDVDPLVDAIHGRFVGNWLMPLADDPENPVMSTLSAAQRAMVVTRVRAWLTNLLADGESGLVRLQTDSGGGLNSLSDAVQAELVRALIATGTPDEVQMALELARQIPGGAGPTDSPMPQSRLYPVEPVRAWVPPGEYLEPAPSAPISPAWWVLLAVCGGLVVSVLALRRWPKSRAVLFPIGGLGIGVLVLLGAEGVLALMGVRPLAELRPTLDPNRVGADRYEPVQLEGQPSIRSFRGGHRYEAFPTPKPPGLKRVVVLGESSVHGTHYLAQEAFPALLEAQLGVEVINAGIGGALSDEIMRGGLEFLRWETDLLVLYFGYNDLTHIPYMESYEHLDLGGMQVRRGLSQWRLARVIADALPSGVIELGGPSGPPRLSSDAPSQQDLMASADFARTNAAGNMVRLAQAARDQGVAVLLVAQATNESGCPPTESRGAALERGCPGQDLARVARDAARLAGLPVYDAARLMRDVAEREPEQAPERWEELFWDGVHPTRLGHATLAEGLAPAIRETLESTTSQDDRQPQAE